MCVFSGKYAKKNCFFEVLETKGLGECDDLGGGGGLGVLLED